MTGNATADVTQSSVSHIADASVQANAGRQIEKQNFDARSHESTATKPATGGTTSVNQRVKAAAAQADGSYTVAHPQAAEEKYRKQQKRKARQAKIR